MKNWQDFGKLLKRHRKGKLTQQDLLDRLNEQGYQFRNKATVSRWENGLRIPTLDVVEALEDILDTGRGLLLRAAGYPVDVEYAREEGIKLAHRSDMLGITVEMLADNLAFVSCRHIQEQFEEHYLNVRIFSIKNVDGYLESDLSKRLRQNFVKLFSSHDEKLIEYFNEHLITGYPEAVKGRLQDAIDQNPYELIEILRFITASRKIKGTCPVCKDLQ